MIVGNVLRCCTSILTDSCSQCLLGTCRVRHRLQLLSCPLRQQRIQGLARRRYTKVRKTTNAR